MLLDIERIAPCLPGAQLQEVEGDEYRGIVKVKVGPITAQYKGTATLAEVDEPRRRIVIDASGRDTRGQGNAKATIVVTMRRGRRRHEGRRRHRPAITGKVAQFGRGVLVDVSSKLMGQFVENLERDVLATQDSRPTPPAVERRHDHCVRRASERRRAAPPRAAPDRVDGGRARRPARRRPGLPVDRSACSRSGSGCSWLFVLWRILRAPFRLIGSRAPPRPGGTIHAASHRRRVRANP